MTSIQWLSRSSCCDRPPGCARARFIDGTLRGIVLALAIFTPATIIEASGISGTMSNFDVFNDTSTDAYGAEIELEGISSSDVTNTFPSHFDQRSIEDYSDGVHAGTRIRFSGYNFDPSGFLAPTVGQNTNGHFCVNVVGCEHFGFAVRNQPTATRYYWLDQNLSRIGADPLAIPQPTWSYQPPANAGQPAVLAAQVEVPEPAEQHQQRPDSIWMKVYKTELERPVSLDELVSNGGVAPEDEAETETEWELLEGGKADAAEADVGEQGRAVLRRYEYFKYTGAYDDEHEPISAFLDGDLREPPAGELGDFVAANMVAANLVPLIPGDANYDGTVDLADFNLLKSHFANGSLWAEGDFNSDGRVGLDDFNILKGNFGAQPGNAVPEPAAWLLLTIGTACSLFITRRSTHRQLD
jgi:hypothetical protein